MSDTAFVYALLDTDGKPRYVGHSKDVEKRAYKHYVERTIQARIRRNPGFNAWLRPMKAPPAYRVIAQVAYADRFKWESFYTDRLRENGFDLLNIMSGGKPSPKAVALSHTPEALAKMAAKMRGRKRPEHAAWMRANAPRGDGHWSRQPENSKATAERAELMRVARWG